MIPTPVETPSRRHARRALAGKVPVRHGRLRRRSLAKTILKFTAGVVAVAATSTAAVAGYAVVDTVSSIKPGIHLHLTTASGKTVDAPDVAAATGQINILLAGTDTRTGQGGQFSTKDELASSSGVGNNDVTMVLHISADHKHADVISIPRDLVMELPKCERDGGGTAYAGTGMFNTSLSRGGLGCVVAAAEKLTGLTIPFAAEISFDGVTAMSNAIGGVSVCLATPVKDPYVNLDLAAGTQTLVGWQALAFVRSRHGVGDGSDLGRISNQQLFLSSLLRKVTSAGTMTNPVALYSLARAATQNVQLSDTLISPTTMVSIALAAKGIPLNQFVFMQYPVQGDPDNPNRVIANESAADLLKQALSSDTPLTLTGTTGVATQSNAATSAPTAPPTSAAAAPSPTSEPAPAATAEATAPATPEPSTVALPSNVTGQTADQQTCTKGNN